MIEEINTKREWRFMNQRREFRERCISTVSTIEGWRVRRTWEHQWLPRQWGWETISPALPRPSPAPLPLLFPSWTIQSYSHWMELSQVLVGGGGRSHCSPWGAQEPEKEEEASVSLGPGGKGCPEQGVGAWTWAAAQAGMPKSGQVGGLCVW